MKAKELHRWDVTPAEAREIQERLRARVELKDRFATEAQRRRESAEERKEKIEKRGPTKGEIRNSKIKIRKSQREVRNSKSEIRYTKFDIRKSVKRVAGADVAFDFHAGGTRAGRAIAGVIVYSFPEMKELERAWAERELKFPYVPGLLSFREIPALLAAFAKLQAAPDVVFCDGQGYSHPRRFGLASHLGVLLDCVSVGCAKSRLIGEHEEPGRAAGSWAALQDEGEVIGAVLRTRDCVKPIYVSQGHRVSLATAIQLVLATTDGFRIPLPTRQADYFVEEIKHARHPASNLRLSDL